MLKGFKVLVFMAVFSAAGISPAKAGIPVIDGVNLVQSILQVLEAISQTARQIEQYKTQLEQYENQIRNTVSVPIYTWNQTQRTISGLLGAMDSLDFYINALGNIDRYLAHYQDLEHYRTKETLTAREPSVQEQAALAAAQRFASEAQKRAYDASMKSVQRHQSTLRDDARLLGVLQSSTQGAVGQMQAIQYGNQLASAQANQLLQIRALLVSQQNAIATRLHAIMDEEAKQKASAEQFRRGSFVPSRQIQWGVGGER